MAKAKHKPVKVEHLPRAGRTAYACDGDGGECQTRRFVRPGDPVPICERHGQMKRSPNHPYRGLAIPDGSAACEHG